MFRAIETTAIDRRDDCMRTVLTWMRLLAGCVLLTMLLRPSLTTNCCVAASAPVAAAITDADDSPAPQDLTEMAKESGSRIFARTVVYLRDLALHDAEPIPLEIQEKLAAFFPADILAKVRYSIAWNPLVRSTLREFIATDRYSLALTLDYVIVFADDGGVDDLWLWAHELTHVQQYARWGIETFARFYIDNYRQVEQEADDYAGRVMRKIIPLSSTHNSEFTKEHP